MLSTGLKRITPNHRGADSKDNPSPNLGTSLLRGCDGGEAELPGVQANLQGSQGLQAACTPQTASAVLFRFHPTQSPLPHPRGQAECANATTEHVAAILL